MRHLISPIRMHSREEGDMAGDFFIFVLPTAQDLEHVPLVKVMALSCLRILLGHLSALMTHFLCVVPQFQVRLRSDCWKVLCQDGSLSLWLLPTCHHFTLGVVPSLWWHVLYLGTWLKYITLHVFQGWT